MILILSRDGDSHVRHVVAELDRLGHPWYRFDPFDVLTKVQVTVFPGELQRSCLRFLDGTILYPDEITSVWNRRPSPIEVPKERTDLLALEKTFIEREGKAGMWGMLRALPAFWVNHPDAVSASSYKIRQLEVASSLQLSLPHSLVTNVPERLRSFYKEHQGRVVYKLMGYPAYEDSAGIPLSTHTSLIPLEIVDQAERVSTTTHFFQEYIDKQYDVRVVIMGERVFATEIHAHSEEAHVDFRVDYSRLTYRVHQLPAEIEQQLLTLNAFYGLHFSAIDLVRDSEGRYYFLELNPSGQFAWLEEPTGIPLHAHLAQLLIQGKKEQYIAYESANIHPVP
ncbi:ATP-grasp ribosomal peptide maturase [Ktedonobacter sp. SOSP1-85]|uniref:MvdC/MvdD family ATP grasp protein n=1 Tax=Ktedonobacter sp. SOSP1-85 TaxID=2778367 RepID=UPI0019162B93|nr:hypothetical protein [Ktedonobacter sp. SOSP1-85]GHO79950.1 ATP-grasp ribosomal peptide maturase [Ktedonobacter sp. SOSP1-85]